MRFLTANRFIPVLTGNSKSQLSEKFTDTVYPRTHGEQATMRCAPPTPRGLSPYSRGTGFYWDLSHCCWRFIPVLTGNSHPTTDVIRLHSVYPRTHGEQVFQLRCSHFLRGLSPYSRGTGNSVQALFFFLRFIPVLTGNSKHWR